MSKRTLTRRQNWRIKKIQDERLARAERRRPKAEADADASLGPEQPGRVIANFGARIEVEDEFGIARRCHIRQNLELPVVGDRVVFQAGQDGSGVVVALMPRRTTLARPDHTGAMKPLAANIDQILVVAAPQPPYSTDQIDPYLVAAEANGITPAIVFNKVDLLTEADLERVERDFAPYRRIGYRVIHASTKVRGGLDELLTALANHVSIFAGQSGVGKSSLVQTLLPQEQVAVGALADSTGLGRHTTSAARLYRLSSGGEVIDSPGVRAFRLWGMPLRELAAGFVEFHPFLGHCRFRDCRHEREPGCAIAAAVEAGAIAPARLASFHRLAREQSALEPGF